MLNVHHGLCRALILSLLLLAGTAAAQTQIRGRVIVLVDTSGSMVSHLTDANTAGGDGSFSYDDGLIARNLAANANLGLFVGSELSTAMCPGPSTLFSYDGSTSRMFATKTAVTNAISANNTIDWGLIRYSGAVCPFDNSLRKRSCAVSADCGTGMTCAGGLCSCTSNLACNSGTCDTVAGLCTCANDNQCRQGSASQPSSFCVAGRCVNDGNLCFLASNYLSTDTRPAVAGAATSQACGNHTLSGLTYGGNCGTNVAAGNALCATAQTCSSDATCTGGGAGRCTPIGSSAARTCTCSGNAQCPAGYVCSAGRCAYNRGCIAPGGQILVDPSTTASTFVLPSLDGIEDYRNNGSGLPMNPELRAAGPRPLAGAVRAATAWYEGIKATAADSQILCRRYTLVLIVDGDDNCESGAGGDSALGPIAATQGFVAATAAGAKRLNQVYVIALSSTAGGTAAIMNAIAAAGGTTTASFANTQADIQAAIAAIDTSSCDLIFANGFE